MSENEIVAALRAKRVEASDYIHDLEKKARTWRARLAHIDAAIKIFTPETDPEAIPPRRAYRRSRYFQRGEFARLVLEQMRKAGAQPIVTNDLATALLSARELPTDDARLLAHTVQKTLGVLRNQRKRGAVTKTGEGRGTKWVLASRAA
jgi:hypothetical protein